MKKLLIVILLLIPTLSYAQPLDINRYTWDTLHFAKGSITYLGGKLIGLNEEGSLWLAFGGAVVYELVVDEFGWITFGHQRDKWLNGDPADIVRDMLGTGLTCCLDLLLQWKHRTYIVLNNDQKRVGVILSL